MVLNFKLFDNIDKIISPDDNMFQGNQDHYYYVGYSGIKCIDNALTMIGKDPFTIKTILDIPSGHGRVLRWIIAAFPGADITACDLDTNAVDFCSRHFEVKKIYSNVEPDKIICEDKYDLIWCGSLFTHLQRNNWKKFLKFFNEKLNPGGILIFTTHGPYVASRLRNGIDYGLNSDQRNRLVKHYDDSGFGYENYNLNMEYGISVAKPSSTLELVEATPELKIIFYQEKGWDHHQDAVTCIKDTHFEEIHFDYSNEFKQLFLKK